MTMSNKPCPFCGSENITLSEPMFRCDDCGSLAFPTVWNKRVEIVRDKVAYNKVHGGFGLSDEAVILYAERKGWEWKKIGDRWGGITVKRPRDAEFKYFSGDYISRDDPDLIAVIEHLGTEKASGMCCSLEIATVTPAQWRLGCYDGKEWLE